MLRCMLLQSAARSSVLTSISEHLPQLSSAAQHGFFTGHTKLSATASQALLQPLDFIQSRQSYHSQATSRPKLPSIGSLIFPAHITDGKQTTSCYLSTQEHRQASSDASTPSEASTPSQPRRLVLNDEWELEYEGTVSSTIRTLKLVSMCTAVMSLIGSPLYIYATMDGQYTTVKIFAASGFTCFGLFTTGLLHWFVGPYVHRLWFHPESRLVKVQMLNLFAQPREIVFRADDVQLHEGIEPLGTFTVRGRTMFIDEATFDNKELLEVLTPASQYDMDPESPPGKEDGKE